jgi:predicted RNase H-like HicB family nuclease
MSEIIFQVFEDELDGGFTASALGFSIHTQADSIDELKENIKEAIACHFEETQESPRLVRLHFVRDEVFAI